MLHNNLLGTIGQLGRSFGLWEPETPVQIRVVPLCIYPTQLNLVERWTVDPNVAGSSPAVGIFIIISNLFYSIGVSFRIFNFFKMGLVQTFIYNNKYIILMSIIYSHSLPWWCRGYHVGLSSPRLGFKSRPGRLTIC